MKPESIPAEEAAGQWQPIVWRGNGADVGDLHGLLDPSAGATMARWRMNPVERAALLAGAAVELRQSPRRAIHGLPRAHPRREAMSEGVTVTMKDGTKRRYVEVAGRQARYRVEGVMVIVTDAYGAETAYPVADVQEVHKTAEPRGW